MNKLVETRREMLKGLVEKHGLTATGIRLGKPARQLRDMIAGRKSFGDKVARAMEEEGELPPYYFDGIETEAKVKDLYTTGPDGKKVLNVANNINTFEEMLLMCFRGMNLSHKEELLYQANHFYKIDNPHDKTANPYPPLSKKERNVLKSAYEFPLPRSIKK
jgi:hypothetical protein